LLISILHSLILLSLMLSAGLTRVQPFVAAGNRGNVQHYYSRHTSGAGRAVQCSAATMQQVTRMIALPSIVWLLTVPLFLCKVAVYQSSMALQAV
jgi:hypothetical protein